MNEILRKNIAIGFSDFSIEKRKSLIFSDLSSREIRSDYPEIQKHFEEADQVIKWLDGDRDGNIWWYGSDSYPEFPGLSQNLPYMLFVKGTIPSAVIPRISIVGTRKASYRGLNSAFELGLEAGFNGYSVVSGLAEGCDQAASLGCLCTDSPCIEVLGCGLCVDYPKLTINLRKRIVEGGGAIISRFPPLMPPLKHNFPNRNVIIAALSCLTVIVQAPVRSGALHTADFALQMGKDLMVSASGLEDRFCCRGTSELAEAGCPVIFHISDYNSKLDFIAQRSDLNGFRFQDRHYVLKNRTF